MSVGGPPLKLAIVSGEESGDLLGIDLVRALSARSGRPVDLVGVGGRHLQSLGLKPLFDPGEIAIMGLTAVVRDLPNLVRRIGQTARHIVEARPDCLVTIDSPAFNLRVARKVRAANPSIPIVKYVCPSVWAWAPWRASKMKPHTDHVLCLLPFEPAELRRLGGPEGTFVGHRLAHDADILAAARSNQARVRAAGDRTLLLLPGSRRAEVSGLIGAFGETVSILASRGVTPKLVLPTVPSVERLVRDAVAGWPLPAEIVTDAPAKWQAFGRADAALAASGTVSLELALARVPLVAAYRTDPLMALAGRFLISTWTASLPNLIADRPIVPEYFNQFVRPAMLARHLEALMEDGPARTAQFDGFDRVAQAMATDRPSGELAADVVMKLVGSRQ